MERIKRECPRYGKSGTDDYTLATNLLGETLYIAAYDGFIREDVVKLIVTDGEMPYERIRLCTLDRTICEIGDIGKWHGKGVCAEYVALTPEEAEKAIKEICEQEAEHGTD